MPKFSGSFQVYSSTDDYLGIGVRHGKVLVVVSLGWGSMTVLITDVRVDDGQWHSFDLNRYVFIPAIVRINIRRPPLGDFSYISNFQS